MPLVKEVHILERGIRACSTRDRAHWSAALVKVVTEAEAASKAFPKRLFRASSLRRCWEAVARVWDRLEPADRAALIATGRDRLEDAGATLVNVENLALAMLFGDLRSTSLARHLGTLLRDPSQDVVAAAEHSLRALAADPRAERHTLHDLVGSLAAAWQEHRSEAVLDVAIGLLDAPTLAYSGGARQTALTRWFAQREDPGHIQMRGRLKRADGAMTRRRAWEWLAREQAAAAATERVARARTREEHESVLGLGHLAEHPVRSRRLGLLDARARKARALPDRAEWAGLSVEARRGSWRLIHTLDRARLTDLLVDPDALARHCAVRSVPAEALGAASADPDARVAGTARTRLLCERGTAASGRAERLADVRSRLAGPVDRVQAIMTARRWGLERECELELLTIVAEDADERATATAVAALARVSTDSAQTMVRACLAHASARVRANAADRLRDPALLTPLMEDAHHRVRGSAVRGLMRGRPDDRGHVLLMLADDRPLHRLAGLWVIERALLSAAPPKGWSEWSSAVAAMTRAEPEEPIRERARCCAARMLARMRVQWHERAVAVA